MMMTGSGGWPLNIMLTLDLKPFLATTYIPKESREVVSVGQAEAEDTQGMLAALRGEFIPNKVVLLRPPGEAPDLIRLAEFTKYHSLLNDQATAYVCLNHYCE